MDVPKLTKKRKKGLAFRERMGKQTRGSDTLLVEELAIPQADPPVEKAAELTVSEAQALPSKPRKRKRDAEKFVEDDTTKVATEKADAKDPLPRNTKKRKVDDTDDKAKSVRKTRFILFVGNLRYTTSLEAIREHFATCDPPPQIRLLTPKPKSPASTAAKSKGCAFLEFSHRNALQQGLKLHGSTLDGRRINVELTAGGGGKSEQRVHRVQARNKHLLEERKTRVQKITEGGTDVDTPLIAPPQRHSTTSGVEKIPQNRRTWAVPEDGETSGRGGVKKRGKKGKTPSRNWGTGANAVAVG